MMSPLALVGLSDTSIHDGEGEEDGLDPAEDHCGQEEGRGDGGDGDEDESNGESDGSDGESDGSDGESNGSNGESDGSDGDQFDSQQEFEGVKNWAAFSSSLLRIYLCHAYDDAYNEMDIRTFGRNWVFFRELVCEDWKREELEIGGWGPLRTFAWPKNKRRLGKGVKREDRDVFDETGMGFPEDKQDGWRV